MTKPGLRLLSAGVAVLLAVAVAAAQTAPNLFVDPRVGDSVAAKKAASQVAKLKKDQPADEVKMVGVELSLLSAAPDTPVTLNLPGITLSASGAIESRTDKGFTWVGKVAGDKLGTVILMVQDGRVTGEVRGREGVFRIAPLGDGNHVLRKHDESRLPDDGATGNAPSRSKRSEQKSSTPHRTYVLKALVAYTAKAAETAVENAGNIEEYVRFAEQQANTSYKNSGVIIQLKVMGVYQTKYKETGNAAKDLQMTEVLDKRKEYGADIAVLVADLRNVCGRARGIGVSFDNAFVVVDANCLVGTPTMAHEIGHIIGAMHNWEQGTRSRVCGKSGHGLYSIPGRWRTVMSYKCPPGTRVCTRVLYWSSPKLKDEAGAPMGDPEYADNVTCLNEQIVEFCTGASPCARPEGE